MDKFDRMDCDQFIVGTKDNLKPYEYDLRKVREYTKRTGKSFLDLSEDELKQFEINDKPSK